MFALYKCSHDDTWRYVLGTSGVRPLFVVGINPHIATRLKGDRSVQKVENVALRNGYDSFVMLNVYPVRSRQVADLPKRPHASAISENEVAIGGTVSKFSALHVWAAWGDDIDRREYLVAAARSLIARLSAQNAVWVHYGSLTKRGHPRHPSRLSYSWTFSNFSAKSYSARYNESPPQ